MDFSPAVILDEDVPLHGKTNKGNAVLVSDFHPDWSSSADLSMAEFHP